MKGLILPTRAFGALGGEPDALVSHKFRGSWKGHGQKVRLPYSPSQGYQKMPGEIRK